MAAGDSFATFGPCRIGTEMGVKEPSHPILQGVSLLP